MTTIDQEKREILESLLSAYPYAQVIFDRGAPGVVFPERLTARAQLIEVGYNMNTPIPDLVLDAVGISGALSFGPIKSWVLVPWYAIIGVMSAFDSASLVCWASPDMSASAAPVVPTNVVALDSHRTPKDLHAVKMRRMRAGAPITPGGGGAAA